MRKSTDCTFGAFKYAVEIDSVRLISERQFGMETLVFMKHRKPHQKEPVISVRTERLIVNFKVPNGVISPEDFPTSEAVLNQINDKGIQGEYDDYVRQHIWNGRSMVTSEEDFLVTIAMHTYLAPILEQFPLLPATHDGWYSYD